MSRYSRALLLVVIAVLAVAPQAALAKEWFPLVTCGQNGTPCTACELFSTLKNVIDMTLFGLVGPLATLLFVYAGVLTILYGASPAARTQAKTIATNTVWGLLIISLSWAAVTTFMKALPLSARAGITGERWNEFTCPAFLQESGDGIGSISNNVFAPALNEPAPKVAKLPQSAVDTFCAKTATEQQALAQKNGVPYPAKNSSALDAMLDCIWNYPTPSPYPSPPYSPNQFPPDIKKLTGTTSWRTALASTLFTYDVDSPLCNYTRGQSVCGQICPHTGFNCHDGGAKGSAGSEAADINAAPGQSERAVFEELKRIYVGTGTMRNPQNLCRIKLLNYEVNHTHVSTQACDRDTQGISGP